jgi:hypothetical protein
VTHQPRFGFELRRGRFEVLVDGEPVGSVDEHEAFETSLAPGHHSIRMRKGRYSSRDRSFDSSDGEVVSFHCHGTRIWPLYIASIVLPDLAISLERDQ